jgi:uncharacterized protein (DUF58 family)
MASSFISDFFPQNVLKRFFPGRAQITPVNSIRFHLRNIYIVPTAAGLGLVGVVLITLIAAINFQNSLVYMVCFWLGSLLVINILYTFRNLSGLRLEAMGAEPCFAGQNILLELRASSGRPRESIYVGWKGIDLVLFDLQEALSKDISVTYPAPRRGRLHPPRLNIFTRYPTGLTIAWAYATLEINAIVYPAPVEMKQARHSIQAGEQLEDGPSTEGGVSDFSGMRIYQPGDSLRRIHWAEFARTGKLHSKVFVDYPGHDFWLDWQDLAAGSVEQRLSHLCARVLELDAKQQAFGLRLPGKIIQPNSGASHRLACLTALALFPGGHE